LIAQGVGLLEGGLVIAYMAAVGYLGWLGYRRTRTTTDYLIAGRRTHPFVMAISYGATFISTSAIVGFGGVAGMFGMSLLWLVFMNILVGIFIAFVFLGGRTRRMGHALDAHTFPEFLGRRYESRFVQVAAGLVIFLFMPVYAAAVLIGGTEFIVTQVNVDYSVALVGFCVIVAMYVVFGGLKGVMYTDVLQGLIMFVGMVFLLVWTYAKVGGVIDGHRDLTAMADQAFPGFQAMGHGGWTAMPQFGWGDSKYDLWWLVVSTITLGVGIGVLAQPQLAVRFMTVRSGRELNRAVPVGAIFILAMVGVAYTVGAISNLYFHRYEKVIGRLVEVTEVAEVVVRKDRSVEKTIPCKLLHLDTRGEGRIDTTLVAEGVGKAAGIMPRAEIRTLDDGRVEVYPRATSFTRAVVKQNDRWMFNTDSIIPIYVASCLPRWFGLVFLLTLLAAAMSTLSSQFHTLGASICRDVLGQFVPRLTDRSTSSGVLVARIGTVVGIVLAMIIGYYARGGYIVARATAIFFGLCASSFLPAYLGGLFTRWMTRAGAIASMIVGFVASTFWLTFIFAKEATALGVVQQVTGGKTSLLADHPNWPVVDPILVALPLSLLTAVVVSLMTRPARPEHLDRCFGAGGKASKQE